MTTIEIGQPLPSLQLPPIDRTTLALFAGASGDHNPMHIDIDFARKSGMQDVFGHGMLTMAYLGRLITAWQPQSSIRSFNGRFVGITQLQHQLTCTGKVVAVDERGGESLVRVELAATNQWGEVKMLGDALVSVRPGAKS